MSMIRLGATLYARPDALVLAPPESRYHPGAPAVAGHRSRLLADEESGSVVPGESDGSGLSRR